jgi:ABC-type amino acid transport substrate-binding protein
MPRFWPRPSRSAATLVATVILLVGMIGGPAGAGAQTLDRIGATQAIRIGYVPDQAPFAFTGEDGLPAGYAIDLCKKIAEVIGQFVGGVELTFVATTLAAGFDEVAAGRIDMLCGAITITLNRRQTVDFSEPIFVTGASALLRSTAPRDLRELFMGERTVSPPRSPMLRPFAVSRVGVRSDTTTEVALRAAVVREGYGVEIVGFATHAEGLRALRSNDIDAYFADRALLLGLTESEEEAAGLVVGTRLLTREPYGIALKRGDADFRLEVDRVLTEFYGTAEFTRLLNKYFRGDAAALQAQIVGQSIPD